MDMKTYAAGLCVAVMAVTAIAVAPVEAAPKKKQQVYTTASNAPVNRPRARVTVAPRSFLDAGTEVLPGERKSRTRRLDKMPTCEHGVLLTGLFFSC